MTPRTDATDFQPHPSRKESHQRQLIDAITADAFDAWYRKREFKRNIRQGTPYFNGVSNIKPPERHSPSRLLQCHRKTYYSERNAPEESSDPRGIFWFGTHFEEEIIIPFLQDAIAGQDEYVTNSLWVDFTEDTAAGEPQIKGETDPVIVDRQSEPLVLSEIKTKRSLENVNEPNEHHRAQVSAYMRGLSEKYDREVTDAVIVYGSRTNLNIKAFHVEFDPAFWEERVLAWAEVQTTHQIQDDLPSVSPEQDWECEFCSYRERCGKGDLFFDDGGVTGLLPGFTDYPKQKVEEYLKAHSGAKLTPSLAYQYPDLAAGYGVFDWQCSQCGTTKPWNGPDWRPSSTTLPRCQSCAERGDSALLSAPAPADQPVERGKNNE